MHTMVFILLIHWGSGTAVGGYYNTKTSCMTAAKTIGDSSGNINAGCAKIPKPDYIK